MLCRITLPDEAPRIEAMNWVRFGKSADAGNVVPDAQPIGARAAGAPAAPATGDAAKLEQLQRKVAELEVALRTQTAQAREEGLREGDRRVREALQAEQHAVYEQLARSVAEQTLERNTLRAQAEGDLVALALAIARRILHRELSTDPDAITGIAKAALQRVNARELTRVVLHPSHAAAVRACLERLGVSPNVQVVGDPAFAPGDFHLHTERGKLDASVDSQLAEVERGFGDRMKALR
jgi:flagellar assembly protein FliH